MASIDNIKTLLTLLLFSEDVQINVYTSMYYFAIRKIPCNNKSIYKYSFTDFIRIRIFFKFI